METGVINEDVEALEKPSDKFEGIKTPLKKRKKASWQRGLLKKKKRRLLSSHSQVSITSIFNLIYPVLNSVHFINLLWQ